MSTQYKFALGASVVLVTSIAAVHEQIAEERRPKKQFEEVTGAKLAIGGIEAGEVIARAEYLNAPPSYRVRYKAADGRQVEDWFSDDSIADDPRFPKEEFEEVRPMQATATGLNPDYVPPAETAKLYVSYERNDGSRTTIDIPLSA